MILRVVLLSVHFDAYTGIHELVEGTHTIDGSAEIMIFVIVDIAELSRIRTGASVENNPW